MQINFPEAKITSWTQVVSNFVIVHKYLLIIKNHNTDLL